MQVSLTGIDDTEGALQTVQKLSFTAANWNVPQTVRIKGVDDTLVDGNIRYTLTASSSSNDIHYSNKSSAVTVTNNDNDGGGLQVTPASIVTRETGESGSFSVALKTQPVSPVTVFIAGLDSTEGVLSNNQLLWDTNNWNIPQTVTVKGLDDSLADGDIHYDLKLTSVSMDQNYNGKIAVVNVTNQDNEAGILVVDKSTLTTSEPDVADQFNVVLKTQPQTNVTVSLSGLDVTEGRLSADKLVFTPDSWNKPQTVIVTGVDDNLYDRNVKYTLELRTSGDKVYDGVNSQIAQLEVTNLDDYLQVENITVNEGSPYAVFRIYGSEGQHLSLGLEETGTNFAPLAGNAQMGVDIANKLQYFDGDAWQNYSPSQTVTYPRGSTTLLVRVAVKNDTVFEKQETFKLKVATNHQIKYGTGIISDDGQGPIYNDSGAEVLNPDLDDDRVFRIKTIAVNEGSDYAVFTIENPSPASVRLDLLAMAINNGPVATLGVDCGNSLQYFDGSTWQNYQAESKVAINNGKLYVRVAIHNDPLKEGPESLRLIATDDVQGSTSGSCLIRDDGSGSVWLGDSVKALTKAEINARQFVLDDDFDRDGVLPNVEEILATMSASTGHGGNDGDLNADGLIDSDQSAVATMAWIKADYFQAAVDGTLTKVTPIVYIASEPSSSHVQADYEYQLSNIDVKPLIDPAFGGTSAIKLQNAAGEEVLNAWDPLQFVLKPNINTNTQHLNDIDPVRSGTQVKVLIDISRANATLTSLNAYLKFVPQTTIDAAHSANINLLDLDGKPITTEGWYDFTQHRDAKGQWTGDGAHFITEGIDIKAIELTLTDNAFGDNDMSVDRILDPGTPVLKSSRQPVSIISKNTIIASPEV
ncbi:MAG: hypothetical protein EBR59_07355, partial [Methylococcaceae bacterium]|nr:hypothetical protein [Methylococcaceae bacterium]